jgi:fructose-1,6-bisphosphatase I
MTNLTQLDTRLTEADNLTSLQSYLLAEEAKHPGATGRFTWILSAISLSTKFISDKVRRARLTDVLGTLGTENVHDEQQQKLDVIADEALIRCLRSRNSVAIVASEENEQPILVETDDVSGARPYVVLFDPLDGSSNLDTCSGIGTIFSILEHDRRATDPKESVLQPGYKQVAAGYVVYGSSTVLVLTTGNGVQMFVLDPSVGAYMLVDDQVRIPESHKSYSLNEAYCDSFPEGYRKYLDYAHKNGYSSRYIGSMVADIHRVLVKGGVFMYPPTKSAPDGKLRLLYEANPMAMLIEQAGGKSFSGSVRTLEVPPTDLHQRVGVLMGSPDEVDKVREFLS